MTLIGNVYDGLEGRYRAWGFNAFSGSALSRLAILGTISGSAQAIFRIPKKASRSND